MHPKILAGVDLAWMGTRNPTAIAVGFVGTTGVELSSLIESLYGTHSVIAALGNIEDLHGVAVDGPLIITNTAGQRECERQIGAAYGSRKASCHTSNLARFPTPAGASLSAYLASAGFEHLAPVGSRWQLECYPHPALIEIFGLPERLAYKKGLIANRRSGQIRLAELIKSLESSNLLPLHIPRHLHDFFDGGRISKLQGAQLKHNEDALDAVVCMYIGALYQTGQTERVFGTTTDGYIYVPFKRCI